VNVDLIDAHHDPLDPRSEDRTRVRRRSTRTTASRSLQLARQAAAELTVLGPRRDCLVDPAGVEKPLAHSAGHELLDLSGRDAQPGEPVGPIFGDQWITSSSNSSKK
jgi:hypothetical protein